MSSVFYRLLKAYCTTALDFYFRRWEVYGETSLPDGPVIFVPNHQNAFLDAIVVTCSSKKNPWFLTRANAFNKPRVANFLNKLQMLPVYRFRDGYATLRKNEQVMDNVVKKLNEGETILIFAEGSYSELDNLGPLQKGVSRMALAVDEIVNIAIVPVGLRYESRSSFRTNVLVNFGAPMFLKDMGLQNKSPQDQIEIILNKLRNDLEPLMLHIGTDNYDDKNEHLKKYRQQHSSLKEQLAGDQALIAAYPQPGTTATYDKSIPMWRNIMMWYLKINSIIPILIIKKVILAKMKDPQFIGSVKYAGGMVLAPVFWIIQALLVWEITGSGLIGASYLASILICAKYC